MGQKSGLGWVGKNANLINKGHGSFFFIAELIIDLELEPDGPVKDFCGTCKRCIEACPTEAIVEPYVVNGSKCISYFTIELKDAIPIEMKANLIIGCLAVMFAKMFVLGIVFQNHIKNPSLIYTPT
jgi:epoxyqueuosine reductase